MFLRTPVGVIRVGKYVSYSSMQIVRSGQDFETDRCCRDKSIQHLN